MNSSDKSFMVVVVAFFISLAAAVFGINYNECKVYENMVKSGYEQQIDKSFGTLRTIWVKVKE